MKPIEKIEKENIGNIKFSKKEVLMDKEEIKKRWMDLYRAQALGNLLQNKVSLTFESDNKSIYQVYTTVWAVGQDFITLKGGVYLPVNSILEVN